MPKKMIIPKKDASGQAALEYLIIATFMIVTIGVVFFYGASTLQQSTQESKATTAINKIASTVNQVYASGPGSKLTVEIDVPDNVNSQTVSETMVEYVVSINNIPTNFFSDTKAKVTGSLPTSQGVHIVTVQLDMNGTVVIS